MALHLKDFSMLRELHGSKQTIVVAPPECHQHITGPVPVLRGGQEPPPENVNRLHVLTDSGNNLSLCSLNCGLQDVLLMVHSFSALGLSLPCG